MQSGVYACDTVSGLIFILVASAGFITSHTANQREERGNDMSEKIKPLWSNNRIAQYAYRLVLIGHLMARDRANGQDLRILFNETMQRMRDEYETERQQLYARIAELEKELGK